MFIYVMDECSRDKLLQLGYILIKEDAANGVWCFENSIGDLTFAELDCLHVVSNVLTF